MKSTRLLTLSLLAAGLAVALPAQINPSPVVKAVETARVACVNSGEFLAPEGGIKVLVRAGQSLDLEFSSTQSELSLLNEKLRTLVGELQKLGADKVANAKAIEEKQTEGLKLQQELQQKQQTAQNAYQQRQQEVLGPLMQKVDAELQVYAKARDISLMLDLSKLGEAVLVLKPELDLTADFINYYNAKNQ